MRDHFQFTEQQMDSLSKKGVSIADLFHMVSDFNAPLAPVSKVSLMHFIDKHGDFTLLRNKKDIVANQVFENLTIKEKIEIGEYLNWIEEN